MQKLSVSFKINVFGFYNSWTDADIQVGSQPYSYLMISNNRSLPSDGVVNTENELKKYFSPSFLSVFHYCRYEKNVIVVFL